MAFHRDTILQAAQVLVDQQKLGQAIQEYQRIINTDPNDARTLLKIGDLQTRLQSYGDAIATYDRVGRYYASQGFALKATAVYKQVRQLLEHHAPELKDHYGHILPELGRIYAQLGLTSDALAAYDEFAIALQRAGRDHEAVNVCLQMVQLDPENPLPHLRLAEASCRVQALPEAIQAFWRAAELLLVRERPDDALKVIERILHFRAEPRFARAAAELYLQKGGHENGLQALAKLQICFQADPKNLDTLALLAHAFTRIGQDSKAVEVYKEMARLAREQDRHELFHQLMEHLRQVAPDAAKALKGGHPSMSAEAESVRAEAVVELPRSAAPRAAPSDNKPPRPSLPSEIAVDETDIEILVEDSLPPARKTAPSVPPPRTKGARLVLATDPDLALEGDDAEQLSSHARKSIVDAESFRKLRLFAKAIETLHRAIERDPLSVAIRQKLRDVLVDAGDREGALAEGINIATIYADRGEAAQAEPLLYQVLAVHPTHRDAIELLAQLKSTRFLQDDMLQEAGETRLSSIPDDEAPLPSFPLPGAPDPHEHTRDTKVGRESVADGIEETLDEAEFYTAQELYEDAITILKEQLRRYPKHPLLVERLREVETTLNASAAKSQTVYRAEIASKEPEVIDIDASLDILDELGLAADELVPEAANLVQNQQIDVDQVFAQFKAGVAAQVSESDSATHYDLGVAYREMGLTEDAINEFQLAGRDPERRCMCYAMVALIYQEQDRLEEATEAYLQALETPNKSVDQELTLHFDIANVYELRSKVRDALSHFEQVLQRNPDFRNVKERIAALRPSQSPPAPNSDADDEDEFDRALNKLFN